MDTSGGFIDVVAVEVTIVDGYEMNKEYLTKYILKIT